jgi:hypothetical protein
VLAFRIIENGRSWLFLKKMEIVWPLIINQRLVHHTPHKFPCHRFLDFWLWAFRPRGVPGPMSKLSPRAPAQMGRRETEHEGGKKTGKEGNLRPSCCPAPRSGALAVGGYKRSRGRALCVGPFSRAANLLVREPCTFLL